mgnify:CR=1 FL=1
MVWLIVIEKLAHLVLSSLQNQSCIRSTIGISHYQI